MVATQSPLATHEHGLVAALRENQEEVYSWIEQAQLKLVGVTLADLGGSGKANDLERRLEAVFRGGKANWNSWWKKVRPALKDYPNYFAIRQGRYELVTEVERIPVEPLLFKSTWGEWSKSEQWPLPGKRALPGPNPPANVIKWDILNRKGAEPERLIPRAISVAEEFLAGKIRTSPSAQKWLEMLLEGMGRYRQLPKQDSYYIGLGSNVLAQLIKLLFERDSGKTLLIASVRQAIDIPGWRKVLASVLWEKHRYGYRECHDMFEYLESHLDAPARIALWDEIALAALSSEEWKREQKADLDRILTYLRKDEERFVIIQRISHRAVTREGPVAAISSFVANSGYSGGSDTNVLRLNASANAAFLAPEVRRDLINDVANIFRGAIDEFQTEEEDTLFSALAGTARDSLKAERKRSQEKLAAQEQKYQKLLDEERNLVRGLRSQIAQNREEARLDIKRRMLEDIAATLKHLQRNHENPPEALLRDAVAGLEIAIQAGGAEWFGKPGELVEFDPRLYEGVEGVNRGETVKVKSRGAKVRGNLTDDFILIKARVNRNSEVK